MESTKAAVLALCVVCLLPTALSQIALDSNGCIPSGAFNPNTNYFSTAFVGEPFVLNVTLTTVVKNAYNFSVKYSQYYKTVQDTTANTNYVLYLCGGPKPNVVSVSGKPVSGYFSIPLKKYGMITTIPANFLQLLGVVSGLEYAKTDSSNVVDPCMQKVVAGLMPSTTNYTGPTVDASEVYKYPSFSFSATQDPGVLNRAEWIKYLALFFNQEDLANSVFQNISSAYQCLNGSAPASDAKPTTAWLSYYSGNWTLSSAKFKLQYVSDAGGQSPPETANGDVIYVMSNPAHVTAFKTMLSTLDVVIDETFLMGGPPSYSLSNFTQNANLSADETKSLKLLSSSNPPNVWSIYGTYEPKTFATAWFESAVTQPQVVLQEILSILHPSMFPSSFQHTFFYNVVQGGAKAVTAADCKASDPTALVAPTQVTCTPATVSGNAASALSVPLTLSLAAAALAQLLLLAL